MDNWKQESGVADSNENRKAYIAALLRERESCEKRGLEGRVVEINAELARCGYEAAAPARRAERRPAMSSAEKR